MADSDEGLGERYVRLRRLLAPCAPGEVSGQLVGLVGEREEKVVGDGAKCLLVSSSELLRSGHVDAGTGLGSLGNKVKCTHKTLPRCMSVACSNLCNEGRQIGEITDAPFVYYMRAGSRDGKRKLKKCDPGKNRRRESGHGEGEMGGAREDS